MYCAYNDPADYINEEWMSNKDNIQTLLRLNIADDLRALAHGIKDEQQAYGIDSNTEFNFNNLKRRYTIMSNTKLYIFMTLMALALLWIIGTIGSFQCNNINFAQCIIRSIIGIAVGIFAAYNLNKLA